MPEPRTVITVTKRPLVAVESQVVDQSGGAHEGRAENHQLAVRGAGWTQAAGFADFQVVGAKARFLEDDFAFALELGEVAPPAADGLGELVQGAVQGGGAGALLVVQVTVARGQGQAVGSAYGWLAHDLHRQVEVVYQSADHRQLLKVLLAKNGQIRLYHVEQFGDYGGHAIEVAGTAATAEAF